MDMSSMPQFVNWAAAAMNAFGAAHQGNQASNYYNYQADLAAADANTARGIGQVQADRIRTAGRYARGTARASYGASGVDVNSGSAADVVQRMSAGSEMDAWQSILNGERAYTAGMNTSAAYRAAGANAQTSGYAGVSKSLLSGLGESIKEGWKTRVKPEQYAANVETRDLSSALTPR